MEYTTLEVHLLLRRRGSNRADGCCGWVPTVLSLTASPTSLRPTGARAVRTLRCFWAIRTRQARLFSGAFGFRELSREDHMTATVRQMLAGKTSVYSVTPKDTIYDALRLMADKNIGAVVV